MTTPLQKIDIAIQSVTNKYRNNPEYQPANITIQPIKNYISIKCLGPHHVANSYDIGLALGNNFYVDYNALINGSEIKATPKG